VPFLAGFVLQWLWGDLEPWCRCPCRCPSQLQDIKHASPFSAILSSLFHIAIRFSQPFKEFSIEDATMSIADEKGTPQDVSTSPEDPSLDSEIFNRGGVDEAGRFAGVHALIVDEDTNRKLRRKIDWHMLPLMGFLYMLQYLDKTTLSYASSMNLKTDINIDSAQYSWYVL
jgi:hypothetical protein